jgi:hypothetical protein
MARQVVRLGTDSRGNFKRDVGHPQKRFYLGRDSLVAQQRALKLEELWACVEKNWQAERRTERPTWDAVSAAIGMAIARGDDRVELQAPPDVDPGTPALVWLRKQELAYPLIWLLLDGYLIEEARDAVAEERRRRFAESGLESEAFDLVLARPTADVREALDAYVDHMREKHSRDGKLSEYGVVEAKYLQLIRESLSGSLAEWDANRLDHWQRHWERRPKGMRGTLSVSTCRNTLQKGWGFFKWLDKQKRFGWRLPADLMRRKVRIEVTQAEQAARIRPKTFTVAELAILYQHATAAERCLMLLGLNCAFAAREIGTLQVAEIHLSSEHPHYHKTGDWVFRTRKKSGVYGEWWLWKETVEAVKYLSRIRPRSPHTELLLTRNGNPVWTPTANGNPNRFVANAWAKLLRRVRKDHPEFPALGFKYLRKTSATLVRRIAGGEAASMFLSHGRATSDDLLDLYAAKPFGRAFKACRRLRKALEPMFATHKEFPAKREIAGGGPELSPAIQRRIKEMRSQGFKVQKIMEELNVGQGSVYRYGK